MTLIILLLAYIGSVFLNRYANMKVYKYIERKCPSQDNSDTILVWTWFVPLSPAIACYMFLFMYNNERMKNWFTGKHW